MKKKLVLVHSFYYPEIVGGAEISSKLLAEELQSFYDLTVLTTHNGTKISKEVVDGVRVIRFPQQNLYWMNDKKVHSIFEKIRWHFFDVFSSKQTRIIYSILDSINPDIILTQNLIGIGTRIWKYPNAKIFHTIRDYNLIEETNSEILNRALNLFHRKRSQFVTGVVGVSTFVMDKYKEKKYFLNARENIIGNVVISPTYRDEQDRYKESHKKLKIGYVGRLSPEKGIEDFLESIELIDREIIDSVSVIGTGILETSLREKYSSDSITFFGHMELTDVYKFISNMDVIVIPSKWEEPFGRVIIEAYRQGSPVISSTGGGLGELNIDSALLITDITPTEIAKKITDVYYREINRNRYINKSLEFVSNGEDYKKFIEEE